MLVSHIRRFSSSAIKKMLIKPVPCLGDNYAYLLLDEDKKVAAAVDPVEPEHVANALAEHPEYKLSAILTTHHHWDHAGGNVAMVEKYGVPCYGGSDKVKGQTKIVKDGDTISLGSLSIKAMLTSGHTMDHVCYVVQDKDDKAVFTGDCMFSSGCGKFFEGTPANMFKSLKDITNLGDETKIYFGHEYTKSNLKFAERLEPDNPHIHEKKAWAEKTSCTTPTTVKNEKLTNPFLRFREPTLRQSVGCDGTDIEVLAATREMKDRS